MKRLIGEYIGASQTIEHDTIISFVVDDSDAEDLAKYEGEKVSADVKKYREGRSISANAYFWKLCGMIAECLGTDKESIYLMMLMECGNFETIELPAEAIDKIKRFYRITDVDHKYTLQVWNDSEKCWTLLTMASLKCYKGSHEFDTKEMSRLIQLTEDKAHDIGLSTWPKEEVEAIVSRWEAHNEVPQ